jgi:hypothetical protein
LREKAWGFSPDAVVLAVFLGNDVRNNSVALEGDQCRPFYVLNNGQLELTGPFISSSPFRMWCMARFDYRDMSIPGMISNAWRIMGEKHRVPTAEHPVEQAINYNIYKPVTDPSWREAWQVTDALITEFAREVNEHHALFLAATLDTGIQVWPDPKVRQRFMRWQGIAGLFYPDEQIQNLGNREGFQVLTLAPALQKYAQEHNVYLHGFSNTPMGFGHWNAAGHEQAGDLMAARLCRMLGQNGAN